MKNNIEQYVYEDKKLKDLFETIEVSEKDDKTYVELGYKNASFDEKALKKELMKFLKMELGLEKVKITLNDLLVKELYDKTILNREGVTYILVSSGKGGVGKSNVSANLANAFSEKGYKVALIDCDIYGSSIPGIFNINTFPKLENNVLIPAVHNNIEIVSVDFLMQAKLPIIWRGPMLGKALNHFFYYTKYSDDIKVVIVDLPPGTGDVPLDLANFMQNAYQVVVTTPHPNAASIAIKAGEMANRMNHRLLGVIENMSYYHHNGENLEIFGFGGGEMVANTLNVPLLAKLEIEASESGGLYQPGERNYIKYFNIIERLLKEIDNG